MKAVSPKAIDMTDWVMMSLWLPVCWLYGSGSRSVEFEIVAILE